MRRYALRDDQWDRIKDVLPGRKDHVGVTAKDNRTFVNAVLWIARTGAPWRDLPERFGLGSEFYLHYKERSKLIDGVFIYGAGTSTLRTNERVERIPMAFPTNDIYATLGVFLILAARDPLSNLGLIWFFVCRGKGKKDDDSGEDEDAEQGEEGDGDDETEKD